MDITKYHKHVVNTGERHRISRRSNNKNKQYWSVKKLTVPAADQLKFSSKNHPLVNAGKAYWTNDNTLCLGYTMQSKYNDTLPTLPTAGTRVKLQNFTSESGKKYNNCAGTLKGTWNTRGTISVDLDQRYVGNTAGNQAYQHMGKRKSTIKVKLKNLLMEWDILIRPIFSHERQLKINMFHGNIERIVLHRQKKRTYIALVKDRRLPLELVDVIVGLACPFILSSWLSPPKKITFKDILRNSQSIRDRSSLPATMSMSSSANSNRLLRMRSERLLMMVDQADDSDDSDDSYDSNIDYSIGLFTDEEDEEEDYYQDCQCRSGHGDDDEEEKTESKSSSLASKSSSLAKNHTRPQPLPGQYCDGLANIAITIPPTRPPHWECSICKSHNVFEELRCTCCDFEKEDQ